MIRRCVINCRSIAYKLTLVANIKSVLAVHVGDVAISLNLLERSSEASTIHIMEHSSRKALPAVCLAVIICITELRC